MKRVETEIISFSYLASQRLPKDEMIAYTYDVYVHDKIDSVKHNLVCGVVINVMPDGSCDGHIESQWDVMSSSWEIIDVLSDEQKWFIVEIVKNEVVATL